MNIGFLTTTRFHMHTGGRRRAKQIYELLDRNHAVYQFNVNSENEGQLPDDIRGEDAAVGIDQLPGSVNKALTCPYMWLHCDSYDLDLIYSYNSWQNNHLIGWLCSRKLDVPFIVGVNDHRSGSGLVGTITHEWARDNALLAADAIVLESDTLSPDIPDGVDSDKITTAPTGIDVNDYYRPAVEPAETPTIFYGGRSDDIELVFESMADVTRQVPDAELRLAGVDADTFPEVTDDNITFLGYVSEERYRAEMASAHVCVVPYTEETTAGRPVKILEYMAANGCIVATDRPYNTQMLSHRENALIAEPEPDAFAEAIVTALEDADLRTELADQAHEDVQAYSRQQLQTKLEAALDIATKR